MTPRSIDREIDQLYQLPPEEFTAARNALARTAGADAAEIRKLGKPTVAAWAVNQLFWKRREVYEALISASTELRKIHKAILGGRQADLREAAKAHDAAVDAALKATLGLLQQSGHPATDTTRQAVLTTLRALPSADAPGRLTQPLQPGGFEMLEGLSIGGAGRGRQPISFQPKLASHGKPEAHPAAHGRTKRGQTTAEAAAARAEAAKLEAAKAASARALREAEQAARREEFEVGRATRDEEKAVRQAAKAREELQAAEEALSQAETGVAEAARRREAAERRAKEAEGAVETARRQHDALRAS